MAELVQRNLELSLADLEPMEASGVCSQQEAIQIFQKRRHYEYKLLRNPPRKADYLSYIQYEIYLYMLFSKRKSLHTERSKSTPYGKLVYSANHIHILFTRALRRFKSDLRIWLQYADFCKRVRHYSRLSKCITKAVRIHPRCSGLWSLGAWTALTFDSDTHAARVLLLSGIRVLPDDQHLWLQLCRLEILHTYKIQKRKTMLKLDFLKEEINDNVNEAHYKAAILVYNQAIEQIPSDPDFRYKFIQLLRDYKDTEQFQDLIYLGLKEEFSDDHVAWLYLSMQPVFRYMDTHAVEWDAALNVCESEVEQIFEEAIKINPTSGEIWEEYIKFKFEVISSVDNPTHGDRVQSFMGLINKSKNAGISRENIHLLYVRFLRSEGLFQEINRFISELGDKIMEMPLLLETIGGELNEDMRRKLLLLLINSTRNIRNFNLYHISIWNIILEQYLTPDLPANQVNSLISGLYNLSLISQHKAIGELLLKLLRWSTVNEPIQEFRVKYQKLLVASSRKWPIELYLFCSEIEMTQEPIDENKIDIIFEKMIVSHGNECVDVWLEYNRVKRLMKNFSGAGECYWRAMKTLNPKFVEDFVNKYTLASLSC
ncbi:hypothetical protein LOD99_16286 [Oopsacas minuta]|uniref:U3 small nucleolar RNA-associated protein 6 N-terminal domain-containing protein n=1 Tax=Oopsacas minuta TaxID=111878 RepID=A0AAV7K7M7_9METZ|nr:hypothetical protein LOD99_16286 [Oopsacas minuta]